MVLGQAPRGPVWISLFGVAFREFHKRRPHAWQVHPEVFTSSSKRYLLLGPGRLSDFALLGLLCVLESVILPVASFAGMPRAFRVSQAVESNWQSQLWLRMLPGNLSHELDPGEVVGVGL